MVEDYGIVYHVGRAYKERLGKTVYIEKYKTRGAGDLLPEVWKEKTMEAIKEAGEEELLEKIKDHCRRKLVWLKTEEQVEVYAMDILAGRIYRYWQDFENDTEIIWM